MTSQSMDIGAQVHRHRPTAASLAPSPPPLLLRILATRRPLHAFKIAATRYNRDWFEANDDFVAHLVRLQQPHDLLALLAPRQHQLNMLFSFCLGPQAVVSAHQVLLEGEHGDRQAAPLAWQALLERTAGPQALTALLLAWIDHVDNEPLIARVCEQLNVTPAALEQVKTHLVFAGRYRWKGLGHLFGDSCQRKFDKDLAATYGPHTAAGLHAVAPWRPQVRFGQLVADVHELTVVLDERPGLRDAILSVLTSLHAVDPSVRGEPLACLARAVLRDGGHDLQHLQIIAALLRDGVCHDLTEAAGLAGDLD